MKSIDQICNYLNYRQGVEMGKTVPKALLTDLGVDSLSMLELVFEFEDKFGVTLPHDLKSPRTIDEMVTPMDGLIACQKA